VITTLNIVSTKKPEPSADETAARSWVQLAGEQGFGLAGRAAQSVSPGRLLETAERVLTGPLVMAEPGRPESRFQHVRTGPAEDGC
jgi:hypothetical protein